MDPIENPYAPGAGSRPPALTGRDRELESFRVLIGRLKGGLSAKGMMITGLRGVGKTVLLTTFRDIAESQGFKTSLSEITHETDFKSALARQARRIVLSLSLLEKVKDKVWQAAGVLKSFSLKIPDGPEFVGHVDLLRGRGDSGNLSDDLGDVFVAIGEAAKERKTGVVFLFDELQFLERPDLEALIAAVHQISQRNLPLTVVGAGLPQLPKIAGEAKSYAERLFDFPRIDRLDDSAAREALERPAQEKNVTFDPKATDAILRFTENYPYFLQEFGKHVWNVAMGPSITKTDVDEARSRVTAQLDENFFRVRIDRTTPKERDYLIAMASLGRGPYKTGDIADILKRETTAVAPLRGVLINKGLIYSSAHGVTDFTVPQFDGFLRRTFPERQARA